MNRKFVLGIGMLFLLLVFAPIHSLRAQSSKAQLTDLVNQLQNSPNDQELRKKIITLVSTMSTKPETPEDLDVLMGKAKAIIKDAKTPDDFKQAVDALNQASLLAPWIGDIYYNLGIMQEKANQPADAINSFNLYLLAKPHAKDRKSVKEKIGSLEYAVEKTVKKFGFGNSVEKLNGYWWAKTCDDQWGSNGGCGQSELDGENWYVICRLENDNQWHYHFNFVFPGDGTIKIGLCPFEGHAWGHQALNLPADGDVYGVPNGSNLKDVHWEVRTKDGQVKQIYSVISEDGTYLKISGDRPILDSAFDPNTRYHYLVFEPDSSWESGAKGAKVEQSYP